MKLGTLSLLVIYLLTGGLVLDAWILLFSCCAFGWVRQRYLLAGESLGDAVCRSLPRLSWVTSVSGDPLWKYAEGD